MSNKIDYLALERKEQPAGSYNEIIKNLVVAIRHGRTQIPAEQVKEHVPKWKDVEAKLQKIDKSIGEPKRQYVNEIWQALEEEPERDPGKSFAVCAISARDDIEMVLLATGLVFPQRVIAEEWIREQGEDGIKYTILEMVKKSTT